MLYKYNIMRIINTILDLIFPVNCLSCGKRGSDLCLKCLCESPRALRESAEWIFPLFDYRHPPIKKAIWLLKYKNKRKLAEIFAEGLYGTIVEELAERALMQNFREPILIPIPLSPKRRRERGFNQVELICQKLIEFDGNKNFRLEKNVLIKKRETEHQARIRDRNQRLKNLKDSFRVVNESLIKKRNIILIDDVTTTGATLSEAKKILKQNGAKKIIAFAVAH
jgi:competence protein ComFC